MKKSTKQKVEGKVLELKGVAKEKVGAVTNDTELEASGIADQVVGKVKRVIGKAEETLGD